MDEKKLISEEETKAKEEAILRSEICFANPVNSAFTINSICRNKLDILTLAKELRKNIKIVLDGSTRETETMLYCQAKSLDLLYNEMIRNAIAQGNLDNIKAYLEMAFKAQNTCRKTLLALNAIQNPPQKQIVEQQNIALNQQVNNGDGCERNKIKHETELLSEVNNAALDVKGTQETIRINTPMAAMDTIDRGKNTPR